VPPSSAFRKWSTPPQVAEELGVNADKVVAWIKSGELRAINVAARLGGRPRFRISEADLLAFQERRSAVPIAPRPKRQKKQDGIIEFF
jgi:excisionase family DNA binding protein